VGASTSTSPPTRRVMDVLQAVADAPQPLTSSQLATACGISSSTCALLLTELDRRKWVARRDDRRYVIGSGLLGLVNGLRRQFPLLDHGRHALDQLQQSLHAACSMSMIGDGHLTTIDAVGHATDGEHAVGQRFPIDPPFGLVAMAWRDDDAVDRWLRGVTPRLTRADIESHRRVLADIRDRGYGAWRFDDAHMALHERLTAVLASMEPGEQLSRRLSSLMTMVTLISVTRTLENDLATAEFIVIPVFGKNGQPQYQIEARLSPPADLTLATLDAAVTAAQRHLAGMVS
jgi:DNA-binding IclR family transcriptional regulator